MTYGRSGNDVQIDTQGAIPIVSMMMIDLGSTNGTLLNGHPVVKRQILSTGDKIRVGHTELTFEVE